MIPVGFMVSRPLGKQSERRESEQCDRDFFGLAVYGLVHPAALDVAAERDLRVLCHKLCVERPGARDDDIPCNKCGNGSLAAPRPPPSVENLQMLHNANALDIALYAYAAERFDAHFGACFK